MTNKEKAREISMEIPKKYFFNSQSDCYDAALEMAEWKEKEMIDNVCKWLKFNIYKYAWMTVDYDVYIEIDELLEDMEKEILKED